MENNISNLIHEREMINSRMERMIYGSIEIREKSNNRYIYVHRRIDGIKESKYVGEYSNELYTMIVSNNELAIIKIDTNKFNIDHNCKLKFYGDPSSIGFPAMFTEEPISPNYLTEINVTQIK